MIVVQLEPNCTRRGRRHWTWAGSTTAAASAVLCVVGGFSIGGTDVPFAAAASDCAFIRTTRPSLIAQAATKAQSLANEAHVILENDLNRSQREQETRIRLRHWFSARDDDVEPVSKPRYLPFGVRWKPVEERRQQNHQAENRESSMALRNVETSSSIATIQRKLQWIKATLEQELQSTAEVDSVLETLHSAMYDIGCNAIDDASAASNSAKVGLLDFLITFLDVTRQAARQARTTTITTTETTWIPVIADSAYPNQGIRESSMVTKEMLLACIWHYNDLESPFGDAILGERSSASTTSGRQLQLLSASKSSDFPSHRSGKTIQVSSALSSKRIVVVLQPVADVAQPATWTSTGKWRTQTCIENRGVSATIHSLQNGDVIDKILRGAAQIHRVERLARTVVTDRPHLEGGSFSSRRRRTVLSNSEAARWRGLMLTVADFDWRSLLLRCVACLYQLERILVSPGRPGFVDEQDDAGADSGVSSFDRTPEVVWAAREAMRVHATLAQQLGLDRLKARIEDCAFEILYPRQYRAVTALYANARVPSIPRAGSTEETDSELMASMQRTSTMESVSSFLHSSFTETLLEDSALMSQLESLSISSRVKAKKSLWTKLVQKRLKEIQQGESGATHRLGEVLVTDKGSRSGDYQVSPASSSSISSPSSLSVADVKDVLALRVILRARKWHVSETAETTRAREQLLCYYVREKLRSQWPSVEPRRVKDYIQYPKANGYQSLHYTSAIRDDNVEFPFEVQVRSDEMHFMAEHGVAKHWAYKLGNQNAPTTEKIRLCLPESTDVDDCSDQRTRSTANSYLNSLALQDSPCVPVGAATESTTGNAYLDSLTQVRQLIAEHQVYVFVTTSGGPFPSNGDEGRMQDFGQLVSIPAKSTIEQAICSMVTDFKRERVIPGIDLLHCDLTDTVVLRNGRKARLDDGVENGDVLVLSL